MSKALVPLGLIAAAGVMGSLAAGQANRHAVLPGRKFKSVGSTTIRFDRDFEEYVVIPQGAESDPDSWYYTDDRDDAMDTAKFIEDRSWRGASVEGDDGLGPLRRRLSGLITTGQRVKPRRSNRRRRRRRRDDPRFTGQAD